MININHILSGQSVQVPPVSKTDPLLPDSSTQVPEKLQPLVGDRFSPNQPWKNKATATGANASGCRCGSCPRCGAGAYTKQQEMAEGKAVGQGSEKVTPTETSLIGQKDPTGEVLLPEELAQLHELQKIDQKVRAHEQAHMGAAGGIATSGVSLSYAKGPDGQNYAVGGEVSIDTSRGATPRETLSKMMKVRAAALAPSDPSPQDRKVAASASVAMGEARSELQLEQKGNGKQVVEEAGQRIAGEGEGKRSSVEAGGSYHRGQYQKATASG